MTPQIKYEMNSTTQNLYKDYVGPATEGSAGIDLRAAKSVVLEYNQTELIPTGLKVEIPKGHVGLVFLRSSLGAKGYRLSNGVGVIDSDYRGEILLPIHNLVPAKFVSILEGDRLAQLVVLPIVSGAFVGVEDLSETDRGSGGFGSTGTN